MPSEFAEAMRSIERELNTVIKNYGKLNEAHETIIERLGQAENTIRYGNKRCSDHATANATLKASP